MARWNGKLVAKLVVSVDAMMVGKLADMPVGKLVGKRVAKHTLCSYLSSQLDGGKFSPPIINFGRLISRNGDR